MLFGTLIGASADAGRDTRPDGFCGIPRRALLNERSLDAKSALPRCPATSPTPDDLLAFQTLVGLLLTNGPGAISAQGAKGAVSADGPERPERVQLNKALVGFLTHTGYTHGGNGYEGIAFLIEQFRDSGLADPADPAHGIDLQALATALVERYARVQGPAEAARQPRHREAAGREPSGVQGQAGQLTTRARCSSPSCARSAASTTCSTTFYRDAGAGAVRRGRLAQRLLRQRRRGDRRAAAEDAVAAAIDAASSASANWRPPRSRSSSIRACSAARRKSTTT